MVVHILTSRTFHMFFSTCLILTDRTARSKFEAGDLTLAMPSACAQTPRLPETGFVMRLPRSHGEEHRCGRFVVPRHEHWRFVTKSSPSAKFTVVTLGFCKENQWVFEVPQFQKHPNM